MEARRNGLARRIEDLGRRVANLTNRFQDLLAHKARAESEAPGSDEILTAEKTAAETKQVLRTARATAETAETERIEAQENGTEFERAATEARSTVDKLETEEHTLAKLLDDPDSELFPKLIDAVAVQHGYERRSARPWAKTSPPPPTSRPPFIGAPCRPRRAAGLAGRSETAFLRRSRAVGARPAIVANRRCRNRRGPRLCGPRRRQSGRPRRRLMAGRFYVAAGAKTATAMRRNNAIVWLKSSGIAAARTQFQAARRAADQAWEIAKIKSERNGPPARLPARPPKHRKRPRTP